VRWHDIPVFPNDAGDWGTKTVRQIYDYVKADCLITQMDVWVLREHGKDMMWFPYCPVDQDPLPPLVKRCLKTSKKVIAMSQFGVRKLTEAGIPNWYIPHGVDTKTYYPDRDNNIVRKVNGWGNKFVIGCVATNKAERKNFRKLIMAFKEFHDKYKDSILYLHTNPIEGEGIPLPRMAKTLGIENDIHFSPQKVEPFSEKEMAVIYNSFDVFCLPSKGEGFGLPIIEAQACGVPVIITDFSAMSQLCGSGYLLKNWQPEFERLGAWWADADKDEIVQALEKVYYAPRGVKHEAVEFAKQYDWDVVTEKYWKPVLEEIENIIFSEKEFSEVIK